MSTPDEAKPTFIAIPAEAYNNDPKRYDIAPLHGTVLFASLGSFKKNRELLASIAPDLPQLTGSQMVDIKGFGMGSFYQAHDNEMRQTFRPHCNIIDVQDITQLSEKLLSMRAEDAKKGLETGVKNFPNIEGVPQLV